MNKVLLKNKAPQSLGTHIAPEDTIVSYIWGKHNSWILHCTSIQSIFFLDPCPIEQELIDCMYSARAKKYYCVLTRQHRTKLEYYDQWKQLFPFQLITHSPAYFDFNIYDEETQLEKIMQEILEENIEDLTLVRGRMNASHCLLAYKKPFLFSGEILQRNKNTCSQYNKISKTILAFLKKLPKETLVLPSLGPIEILELLLPLCKSSKNTFQS